MGGRIKIGMVRYYKESGEAGRVLQIEGWRAGVREGGMENITNERIETVISATGVYIISMM